MAGELEPSWDTFSSKVICAKRLRARSLNVQLEVHVAVLGIVNPREAMAKAASTRRSAMKVQRSKG